MSIDELHDLDATALAALVRSGETTPLELVDAAIARIERFNPALNAVIHPRFDKARDEARGTLPDGPFKGVPFLVKDLMCATAGDPYHGGMQFLKNLNWTAPHDSHLAQRYREAGFVFVGRTNTPEFGTVTTTEPLAHGPTRNPWDPDRSAGGSSGGSAAAVAARMVPVANGGDGGGSIRVPASCCGLFGLKPTRGRISSGPDRGEVWLGFAVQHVLGISVRDSAAILDATAMPFTGDPYFAPPPAKPFADALTAPLPKLRIGVLRHVPNGQVELHADCLAAVDDAAKLLEDLGHEVEESHPQALAEIDEDHRFMNIVASWVTRDVAHYAALAGREPEPDELEPSTQIIRKMGNKLSAADYLDTQIYLQTRARRIASWWDTGFDLLLTPTMAAPPAPLGTYAATEDDPIRPLRGTIPFIPFTSPFNATGQPAASIPLWWNDDGLPIGIQLVARYADEATLFAIAAQLEAARPWAHRTPPEFSSA